jgi:hypothetical protein
VVSCSHRVLQQPSKHCEMGNAPGSMTEAVAMVAPTIRLPSKAALSFLRTKVWRVPADPRLSQIAQLPGEQYIGVVMFRHDGKTGEKRLHVDGHLVHKSNELMDSGDVIRFELGERICRLEVVAFPGLTDYALYCDDRRIRSIMEERESPNATCKYSTQHDHISTISYL